MMVTLTERTGKFVGMICSMKRAQEMKGSYDDEVVRITTNQKLLFERSFSSGQTTQM